MQRAGIEMHGFCGSLPSFYVYKPECMCNLAMIFISDHNVYCRYEVRNHLQQI